MTEKPDKDSQTEDASEQKLKDAIEKGNTPISKEAATVASLAATLIMLTFFAGHGAINLAGDMMKLLGNPGEFRMENAGDLASLTGILGGAALLAAGPVIFLYMAAGIGAAVAQGPPLPVLNRIQPQFSRLSLAKGWQRLTGSSAWLEFGKTLFKLTAISIAAILAVRGISMQFEKTLNSDPGSVLTFATQVAITLTIALILMAIALVVVDVGLTRLIWQRSLRMTKQEVKDEHKQAEGDPHFKSRRRSIAKERSRRRMISGVSRATLIIANPTHYAVALRYVRSEGGAPRVVAKGQDLIALSIRRVAEENGIPVIEDKLLARSLYPKVEVDQMIPAEFYRAVAEIMIMLQARKSPKRPAIH